MPEAAVRFAQLTPHDGDGLDYFRVSATNGDFSGYLDFYEYATTLRDFARALHDLPARHGHEARLEIGTVGATEYLLLRAYLADPHGHAALEVLADNGGKDRHLARAAFTIDCELSALNRLGEELAEWVADPARPLTWHPIRERL